VWGESGYGTCIGPQYTPRVFFWESWQVSPRTWSIAWICSAPQKAETSNWGSERPKSSPASLCRRVSVPIPRPQTAVCSEYKISHGGRADLAPQFPNSVPGPLCCYLEDTVRLMKRMQAGFRVHAPNQISPCLPLGVFKHDVFMCLSHHLLPVKAIHMRG
jgi:hypothetical protein